jgi:HepT-like protein
VSDARWADVESDVVAVALHFGNAVDLHARGGFNIENQLEKYARGYALMHAMQSGHTSAESAMRRILDILREDRPTGEDWHKALIARLAKPLTGEHARPALLPHEVASDLYETLGFRHRAMHSYGDFDASKAAPAIEAAARLKDSFAAAVAEFRAAVDPPPPKQGSGNP